MFNGYSRKRSSVKSPTKEDVQFFKEDRQDDVISDVYLKKVLYHTAPEESSSPTGDIAGPNNRSRFYVKRPDEEEDGKGRLQWRMVEMRVVRYASLPRLVEAFSTEEGEVDSTYVCIFLVTFRSFCTAREVLEEIIKRYVAVSSDGLMKQSKKDANLKTLRSVLMQWIDGYADDFDEPPHFHLLHQLHQFATSQLQHSDIIGKCRQLLDKFSDDGRSPYHATLAHSTSMDDSGVEELSDTLHDLSLPSDPLLAAYSLEDMSSRLIAYQLTYRDAELFKRLIPYQCMGSVWSRRNKRSREAATVIATVDFFNAVSYRVIATILKRPCMVAKERARLIEKWVEVAHELRILKNFSSLKAVLSGLTYQAVHRLKQAWKEVDDWPRQVFQEMLEIFSEENNQQMARELLMLEGTAKHADPDSCETIRQQKLRKNLGAGKRKSSLFDMSQTMQGTVPYLGTFLTDLTMIDTGMPDRTPEGLINFEKKRKEFEVIAQIKLLQSAANLYSIKYEPAFFDWFYSLRVYDDTECYELSCEIERPVPNTPAEGRGHKKKPSLGLFSPKKPVDNESTIMSYKSDERHAPDNISMTSATSVSLVHSPRHSAQLRHSVSMSSMKSLDAGDRDCLALDLKQDEAIVARVILEAALCHETNHYKSILLHNCDRTKVVIQNVLLKFNVAGNPDDYLIFQVLSKKECQIPDKANVFYAVNRTVAEVKFVVRKKTELEKIKQKKRKEYFKKKAFVL